MPKIRRRNLPRAVMAHLLDRVHLRHISVDQLVLFSNWCSLEPGVPEGGWFKRFPSMIVCGEGELVKTFLLPGQAPDKRHMGRRCFDAGRKTRPFTAP